MKPAGQTIISTLKEILEWCRVKARVQVPGEGGERALRARLMETFFDSLFGWPEEFRLSGERYDISLLDPDDRPVITVETKEPGHVVSGGEHETFFARLRHYPSLRHGFITNGSFWERFDIGNLPGSGEALTEGDFEDAGPDAEPRLFEEPEGPKAGRRFTLSIFAAKPDDVETFFAPLDASIYLDLSKPLPPGSRRHKLTIENPDLIASFSDALRDQIADLRPVFTNLFSQLRQGVIGKDAATVASECFDLWCERSYIVPQESLVARLGRALASRDMSASGMSAILVNDYGFARDSAVPVAEAVYAASRKKRGALEDLKGLVWPLYEQATLNYATQTAHVYVARLLLYRIGEDQGVFSERITGDPLVGLLAPGSAGAGLGGGGQPPSVSAIESLREDMAGFAASVYESGEFDWWRVVHRELLSEKELGALQAFETQLDLANRKLLRLLSLYDLSAVDLDIWRDIYQHYLPADERQQLGGFYTPQELVELTLDCAGYKSGVEKLCEKPLIDLASGSGAFVVTAVRRLVAHLEDKSLLCHSKIRERGTTDWERSEAILETVASRIHAIDIHPFATFLTYINFLFAVLPFYAAVRRQRRNFRLDVAIFSGNSLLTPGENAGQHELDLPVNSRIQLSLHARERYRAMAGTKFDLVVGNPPWGGILKGRLAPIFDEHYKNQLSGEYPDTYTGKLDIYGLFYDRALKVLKSGGTVALVTQGSFVDKEWAGPHTEPGRTTQIKGLRRKLAEETSLRFLIDLNPFGQLFFGAMNIPCIAAFEKRPAYEDEEALVLLSSKKSWPKTRSVEERRSEVVGTVRHCIGLVEKSGEPLKQDFASAFRFPLDRLREFAGTRWLLSPKRFRIVVRAEWPRAAQLLEPSQGVTVGGEGCLSIFLMAEDRARQIGLEDALIHRILKGKETKRWRPQWGGNVILYPYAPDKEGKWRPAFTCRKPPVLDALDFDRFADKFEQDYVRKHGGINIGTVHRLLEHRRDALQIVKYPKAAQYLVKSYLELSNRTFKKKNVRDFNREWYEYIWPRDAEIIFGKPKIISPRLTPRVRFALDEDGIGIQDSCISLAVSENTKKAFEEFRRRLSRLAGSDVKTTRALKYLLAFMNSSYAQDLLTTGRRPTPKGHYQIDEQFLGELSIPVCGTKRELQNLFKALDACMALRTDEALAEAERRLDVLVSQAYFPRR